jgi:hypothetical protein
MSDENSELNSLLKQAAAVDGDLAAQAPEAIEAAQELQAVVSLAEENAQGVQMILGLAVPVLSRLYPSLADVYTDEACTAVAGSLGPLLAKYGVSLKDWGGKYQEEIGAALVCGPMAWATVQAIKTDIAARSGATKTVENDKPARALAKPEPALKPGDYGFVEGQAAGGGVPEFAGA